MMTDLEWLTQLEPNRFWPIDLARLVPIDKGVRAAVDRCVSVGAGVTIQSAIYDSSVGQTTLVYIMVRGIAADTVALTLAQFQHDPETGWWVREIAAWRVPTMFGYELPAASIRPIISSIDHF
jgi:hypothetical protein